MDVLRQTSLHAAHQAAGARLVPFAGWEMPLHYGGISEEHLAVRSGAGVFDVSHMGEIETVGPDAEAFLQRILSNDITAIPEAGAQYSVLCRGDGGVIDDLFTYRLGPARFLTVTNAANHAKDLRWFEREAEDFDVEIRDVADSWAMLAVQGPRARAALDALADGELPRRFRTRELLVAGVRALVCGTGYTGEDGGELLVAPRDAPILWDALLEVGVVPAGLGARDTLRLESCFHLYGNDLDEEHSPIEAGLGWCCRPETSFIGAAALELAPPERRLVPFVFTDRGIPRRGNPIRGEGGEGVVTSGAFSPSLGIGIGMGYVALDDTAVGTKLEVDVRGTNRPVVVADKPIYKPGELNMAEPYPDGLRYHEAHDWARVEDDGSATFGITWFAQDAVGEIVFVDLPAIGATIAKDAAYAEIESVKAVSEVIAPLSGEVLAVNEALLDAPEALNSDPYGEGWIARVRPADPAEVEALLSAAAYEELLGGA